MLHENTATTQGSWPHYCNHTVDIGQTRHELFFSYYPIPLYFLQLAIQNILVIIQHTKHDTCMALNLSRTDSVAVWLSLSVAVEAAEVLVSERDSLAVFSPEFCNRGVHPDCGTPHPEK